MVDRPTDAEMSGARRVFDAKPKSNADAWDIAREMYPLADLALLRRVVRLAMVLGAPEVPKVPAKESTGIRVSSIKTGKVRPDNNEKKSANDSIPVTEALPDLPR